VKTLPDGIDNPDDRSSNSHFGQKKGGFQTRPVLFKMRIAD